MQLEDLMTKRSLYDETWRKFAKTHESFMELTDIGLKRDCSKDVRRITEKMELYRAVKQIPVSSGLKSIGSENMSCERKSAKTVSTVISRRSVKSSVDAQREKIALAKMKLEHLKRKQEIDHKLTELSYARDLMEAEMEVEKAHVSFRSLEQETQTGSVETLRSIGDTKCDGQRELKVLGQIRSKENVHHQKQM